MPKNELTESRGNSIIDVLVKNGALVEEIDGNLYCPQCEGQLHIDWFDRQIRCQCDEFEILSELDRE